jgi:hypothetical protein
MAIIDSFKILFGVDPSGVAKGMAQAENRIKSGVQNIISNVLAPLTGALAIGNAFNNFISQADKLGLLADKLGMDVAEIDAWSAAVENAGGSAEAFQGTLKSFSDNLRNAALVGGGAGVEWLYYMGISAVNAEGKLKNLTEVLPDLADKVAGMSKMKSTYILQQLGLDEGTIRLVQKGRKSVEELVGAMKLFAYSKKDAETAREFNSAMNLLGKGTQSVANLIFAQLTPVVTQLANEFVKFIVFLREHENFVIAFFGVLVALSLKFLAAWLMNPVVAAIMAIIAVAALLAGIIDDLIAYMNGGGSALEDLWSIFGTGEEIAARLNAAWEGLKATGKALWDGLTEEVSRFASFFEPALKPIIGVFTSIFQLIGNIMDGEWRKAGESLRNVFNNALEAVKNMFKGAVDYVLDLLDRIWDWFDNLDFGSIWEGIKEFAGGFFGDDDGEAKEKAKVKPTDKSPLNNNPAFENPYAMGYDGEAKEKAKVKPTDKSPQNNNPAFENPYAMGYDGRGNPVTEARKGQALLPPQVVAPAPTLASAALPTISAMQHASAPAQAQTQPSALAYKPVAPNNTKVDSTLNVGTFNVYTNATNADGTFNDAASSFSNQFGGMMYPALSGVNTK